jgi:hypothetical protein
VNWTKRVSVPGVTTTFVGAPGRTLGRTVTDGALGAELPVAPRPTATTEIWYSEELVSPVMRQLKVVPFAVTQACPSGIPAAVAV